MLYAPLFQRNGGQLLMSTTANAEYQAPVEMPQFTEFEPVPLVTSKNLIIANIERLAGIFEVDAEVMKEIVDKESGYVVTAVGDKNYYCKRTGKISPSYGLSQISSCWHPEVTYEQATNPEFAIEFLAISLSKGKCKQWSTCPL